MADAEHQTHTEFLRSNKLAEERRIPCCVRWAEAFGVIAAAEGGRRRGGISVRYCRNWHREARRTTGGPGKLMTRRGCPRRIRSLIPFLWRLRASRAEPLGSCSARLARVGAGWRGGPGGRSFDFPPNGDLLAC